LVVIDMAASKAKKGDKAAAGGAHSHIRARMAYLHKAAIYLQTHPKPETNTTTQNSDNKNQGDNEKENETNQAVSGIQVTISRQYITQMRSIAQKAQQRLSQETKRSFCKRCDLLLVPGETCTEEIQNESKGRRKPWADVLVVRCKACETVKRFPQNQKRSAKLAVRKSEKATEKREGG
jgi:ribonuclease P protein subunit RPR2